MENAQIDLLVIEAKLGDIQAFEQLCRYFHPKLVNFALKLSNNEQLANDAVQNAWLKMTKSIKKLNDPRAFKSWLYKSVRWQTLDLLRNKQHHEKWLEAQELDQIIATKHDLTESGDLLKHIQQLSSIDQQAIHLFYLEQMTLQEISIVLSIPIGTIKSRLNRARNILRNKLTDEEK